MQEEMKQIGEYQLIKSKRIIGMTSTGAARCNVLIQLLQTPIGKSHLLRVRFHFERLQIIHFLKYSNCTVVFEEAAEILESHIVAALTRSNQHLILIGKENELKFSMIHIDEK